MLPPLHSSGDGCGAELRDRKWHTVRQTRKRILVVGAGHNGLIAACYAARAGHDVLVVEQAERPGGGSRTEEVIPGYRFDMHSVAHNILNMTNIPQELDLAGAGLDYIEMNPFSVAVRADGRRVRFYRSVEATVDSIAASDPDAAVAYRQFIEAATPLVQALLPAIRGESSLSDFPARLLVTGQALGKGPVRLIRDVLSPYESLLQRWLPAELVRGPVGAFAAHAGVGPQVPGGALFAFWQAAYHLFGQWHARGGSQSLIDALVRRLEGYGGGLRCSAPVERILTESGSVRGVALAGGEQLAADAVVTAIDPKVALLDLLDPPLGGREGKDLAAAHRSNAVQSLVHIATDRLPPYPNSIADDYTGLQSYVDTLGELSLAFRQAEGGLLPNPLPLYAFTPSALDSSLAPQGHHTIYAACPAAPAHPIEPWDQMWERFVEACVARIEERAPGFRQTIISLSPYTPDAMQRDGRWPNAHPMYLDITLDQLGILRPTRALSSHRTPIAGLYISGAGTNPSGGIAGTPGRMAARTMLHDLAR